MKNNAERRSIHHWGAIVSNENEAEGLIKIHRLEEQCRGYVKAYDSKIIFAIGNEGRDTYEFVIPSEGTGRFSESETHRFESVASVFNKVRALSA